MRFKSLYVYRKKLWTESTGKIYEGYITRKMFALITTGIFGRGKV